MRDPHVVTLHYRVVTDPLFEFKDPPPIEHEEAAFRLRLEDGKLRVEMKNHHATTESAREVVEPLLTTWEIDAALNRGRREMWFEFDRPELIDRSPPAPGVIEVHETFNVRIRDEARAKITSHSYPKPPTHFLASEDVQTLMVHYDAFVAGRERLVDAAYFCLTLLERRAGGRPEAAREFYIDLEVLRKVGFLTSDQVGDGRTARKLSHKSTLRPHTGAEVAWLQAALRALIHRVGAYDFDPAASRKRLAMSDLPGL